MPRHGLQTWLQHSTTGHTTGHDGALRSTTGHDGTRPRHNGQRRAAVSHDRAGALACPKQICCRNVRNGQRAALARICADTGRKRFTCALAVSVSPRSSAARSPYQRLTTRARRKPGYDQPALPHTAPCPPHAAFADRPPGHCAHYSPDSRSRACRPA